MAMSDYLMPVRMQTAIFLGSCVLGLLLGLAFECFRLLRVLLPHPALAVLLEDALCTAGFVLALQCYAVSFGNGRLELWTVLGAALGFVLYLLTLGAAFSTLMRRLRESDDFPHEIGLFLSYPPVDVQGFIAHSANRAEGCKLVGTWRVYGDADAAKKTFEKYRRCTESYCRLWSDGVPLDRLAVVV